MAGEAPKDKWVRLKSWLINRNNYLEQQYAESNLAADAIELGCFRKFYETMKNIEESQPQTPPPQQVVARAGK